MFMGYAPAFPLQYRHIKATSLGQGTAQGTLNIHRSLALQYDIKPIQGEHLRDRRKLKFF